MPIKMIALDLDGTLLNSEKCVTARTRDVLRECERRGIQIVPATGRAMSAVPQTVLELPGVRYGIFTNGASVWDRKEQKSISDSCISWETAADAVGILRQYPLFYDFYIEGNGICEEHFLENLEAFVPFPSNCRFIRETRGTVKDILAYLEEKRPGVQKINLVLQDKESKAEVRERLEQCGGLTVTSSLPWNLELNAAGTTKASGLECLRNYLGMAREETMACGDGENDLSMLKAAGIGVAMANGAPFLKEQADHVTSSNDEDGVAAAIENYAL